ncbi:DNA circularization protein [Pseudomonas sp. GV071]|uniref:DNA circularization protein n=1 Tax=Pseudomonas sp. GV071 TaxID=2135754 RepID=UPI000D3454CF|nr:DNA circularization N-terminal domain-containing protein [Pseudomonas sp. GV071]PTQ68138.1 prophage DNA circulation protein [Pseudomonas sp. GV071]
MSWAETLFDASFRGVPLQVISENLEGTRALSQHGTPYKDGDAVVDLGRAARKFELNVVVYGNSYERELRELLESLDTLGPGELIHPVYGSLNVVVQDWKVLHAADRPNYATVTLHVVEASADAPFFPADETGWQHGLYDMLGRVDSLVAKVQELISGGWVGLLETTLGLPGIGLRLRQLRSQILGVVSGVTSMASNPAGAFDPLLDLLRTPSEIRAAIQLSTPSSLRGLLARSGLPTSVPGSASLVAEVARVGAELLSSARVGNTPDASRLPNAMPSDPVSASAYGLLVLLTTELAVSHAQAATALLDDETQTQTLSPNEIEGLANLVRSLIQAAILLHRRLYDVEVALPTIEALRGIAALVQTRAQQVILLSPPLLERTLESPASLRLLAHRWYQDHSRANELLRLNPTLKTPHNLAAGQVVRAYAQ